MLLPLSEISGTILLIQYPFIVLYFHAGLEVANLGLKILMISWCIMNSCLCLRSRVVRTLVGSLVLHFVSPLCKIIVIVLMSRFSWVMIF